MELEYIMHQCKMAHYRGWQDDELQMCIDKAKTLSRKDLFLIFNSKWLDNDDPFRRKIFFLLHKDEIEKKVVPASVTKMHTSLYNFKKEKVEEYTIGNSEVVGVGFFDGYSNLKKVNIRYNFTCDDDCYTRFGHNTPNLEQFHVIKKQSPLFSVDGVLYLNIDKARETERKRQTDNYYLYNIPNNLSGTMLLAMPPKYKDTSFTIPDFVDVIAHSAFCGSNLKSLTISKSVKYIGIGALGEMEYLKELRVPNQPVCILWDHNYIGHCVNILCSQPDVELGQEIKEFWQHLLENDEYAEDVLEPIKQKLGIKDALISFD